MANHKKLIYASLIALFVITTACYFPEIISSDDYIETQVADKLEEIFEETAEAEPTYTPYPTYTPQPTYTVQPFYYNNDRQQPPGAHPLPRQ